jgi:hypothetical protein
MNNKLFVAVVVVGVFSGIGIYYAGADKPVPVPVPNAVAPGDTLTVAAVADDNHFFASGALRGVNEASIPGGECSLDYLAQDNTKIVSAGTAGTSKKTQFYGWGLVDGQLPSAYVVEMKPVAAGSASVYARLGAGGVERKDVADLMKRQELLKSGFYADGDFAGLSGSYDLFLLMRTATGIYQCSLHYKLTILAS